MRRVQTFTKLLKERGSKMSDAAHVLYGTCDEINFLEKIGSYRQYQKFTRKELLEKYLKACSIREIWNNINKEKIIEFVNQELEKEI